MKKTLRWIYPLVFALLLAGCVIVQAPAEKGRGYSLDYTSPSLPVVVSASSVTISSARINVEGDELLVLGKVKRPHKIQLPGHLDLMVCSAEDQLLQHETTRVHGLSSHRRGMLELPYSFRLTDLPPEESRIRLQYHAPGVDDAEWHQCT